MHQFSAVSESPVVATLEGQHKGVGVLPVEFLAAGDVAFQGSGERLFQQYPMPGPHQRHRMGSVVDGWRHHHGVPTDIRSQVLFKRAKRSPSVTTLRHEVLQTGWVGVHYRDQLAGTLCPLQLQHMRRMNPAHASDSDDSNVHSGTISSGAA